jgi:hypothetical protein
VPACSHTDSACGASKVGTHYLFGQKSLLLRSIGAATPDGTTSVSVAGELGGVAQLLRSGEASQRLQRPVLDLSDPLAGHVEDGSELRERVRVLSA